MRYQNLCHLKKWQNASSTELGVYSISIDCALTETISQDQTTYSINILYAKPVVLWEGGGKPCFKLELAHLAIEVEYIMPQINM